MDEGAGYYQLGYIHAPISLLGLALPHLFGCGIWRRGMLPLSLLLQLLQPS